MDAKKKYEINLDRTEICWFLCPEDRAILILSFLSFCPPLWNFNLANNFLAMSVKALIFHLSMPCDKTFPWVPLPYFREYKTIFFFPSPWVPTYTIDMTYLSFFFLKKWGKNHVFKQNYGTKIWNISLITLAHFKHNRKRKNNLWDIPNQT